MSSIMRSGCCFLAISIMLVVVACDSEQDPAVDIVDGDEIDPMGDIDLVDSDADGDEDPDDFESFADVDLGKTLCEDREHANGLNIEAAKGGSLAICLAGERLDGAGLDIPADGLNLDATVTLSLTDDIDLEGYAIAGPAMLIRAIALDAEGEVQFNASSAVTLPFFSDARQQQELTVVFSPGVPVDESPSDLGLSGTQFEIEDPTMIAFEIERFGVYQAMMPVPEELEK